VFSGVGKTREELLAGLSAGVCAINVESASELELVNSLAAGLNLRAPVSFRVNPDVDARTHPYIATGLKENKFGIPIAEAPELYRHARGLAHVALKGVDCHIGSQQTSLEPFADALDRVLALVDELRTVGIALSHLNVGGGLGIRYRGETPPDPGEYAAIVGDKLRCRGLKLILEPGRAIAGNAGVLLARVLYLKRNGERRFAIVDGAMNDLLRPALYQAWQEIIPVDRHPGQAKEELYDIVGPVCESADTLGGQRRLAVAAGALLAVRSCGAYGFVMSSNYNSRPRAAEVMVDGAAAHLVRRRECVADLFATEAALPGLS